VFQRTSARNDRLAVPSGKQNASRDRSGQEMGVFLKESVKRCENVAKYQSEKARAGSQRPIK
jgi:hypothetical protein